jgi:hypothetical protein
MQLSQSTPGEYPPPTCNHLPQASIPTSHPKPAGTIEKRLPATTPQGRSEQIKRSTLKSEDEGAEGELEKDGGWNHFNINRRIRKSDYSLSLF